MPTRTRARSSEVIGQKTDLSGNLMTVSYKDTNETMTDFLGSPSADHSLSHSQVVTRVPFMTRVTDNGRDSGSVPCNNFNATSPTPSYLNPDGTEDLQWNRALSITNPSRADVLLPAFIAELKDLPGMIKHAGEVARFISGHQESYFRYARDYLTNQSRSADRLASSVERHRRKLGLAATATSEVAKQLAVANLALQFGWEPLIGDIRRLLTFADGVEARRLEIDRLFSGTGLKRRVTLEKRTEMIDEGTQTLCTRFTVTGRAPVITQRSIERWAVLRWKPISRSQLPPSDGDIRQALLGMTFSNVFSVAWELLPWSWLSDYFGNVGSTLKAMQNSIGCAPPKGCVMTMRREIRVTPGARKTDEPSWHISSGKRTATHRARATFVGISAPSYRIPILGERQLSILGSIYTTRAFR